MPSWTRSMSQLPLSRSWTRRVVTASPREPLSAVVDRMMERSLHHVPVVDSGVPVSVLARHDLLGSWPADPDGSTESVPASK
jgi:CBS domain-containing protein